MVVIMALEVEAAEKIAEGRWGESRNGTAHPLASTDDTNQGV